MVAAFTGGGTLTDEADAVSTPPATSGFPNASNTGVPTGTVLTNYTGPGGFSGTQSVTIDRKTINSDIQVLGSAHVTLTNCQVNGHIDADTATGSVTMTDCTVDSGSWGNATTGFQNLNFTRCQLKGGTTSINSSINGYFEDCYLWDQYVPPTGQVHTGGFLCSGGTNITLKHCTVWNSSQDNGDGGGPSASVNLYGDFAELSHITFDNCYVMATAGGYEASLGYNPTKPYGDNPTYIVVKDCVFQRGPGGVYKGGAYGTVTSFKASDPTNVWSNNTWDDGTPIPSDI